MASGCAEVVKALVLKGADKAALDSDGRTPADMAPAGSKAVLEVLKETTSLLSETEQLEQSMSTQTKVHNYVVTAEMSLLKQLDKLKVRNVRSFEAKTLN